MIEGPTGGVYKIETTNSVSVNEIKVKSLPVPENNAIETRRTVSPLKKLQVKEVVCGSGTLHLVAPSSRVPVPAAAKVIILSFWQAGKEAEISMPLAVAFLNLQLLCERSCVFVFGTGILSSFWQEERTKIDAIKAILRKASCFLIVNRLVHKITILFIEYNGKIP